MTSPIGVAPQRTPHRNDIQGLRGLAVMLVVIFHASAVLRGGFVGVDVFFAISGFVICRLLLAEINATGRIDLKTFYLKRFRRLLPALALMLTVVVLFSFLAVQVRLHERTALTGMSTALFSGNAYLFLKAQIGYFDPAATSNPLLHTWSLSVEEQFYFLFPTALTLLAWVARKRRKNLVSVLAIGLAVISAASFAISWGLVSGLPGGTTRQRLIDLAFYASPARSWEFALGALLALWRVDYHALKRKSMGRTGLTSVGVLGVMLVGFSSVAYSDSTLFPGPTAIPPVLGACCLILAGGDTNGFWGRVLGNRVLVTLGNVSYGWYLWHWPFIVFARSLFPQSKHAAVFAAIVSLVPAVLSLKFLENPIRFKPSPTARKTLRLATICIVLPVLAALTISTTHSTAAVAKLDMENNADVAWGAPYPCVFGKGHDDTERTRCTVTTGTNRKRMFLVGDSNATQFTQVFSNVAAQLGVDSSVRAWLGCPFVDARVIRLRDEEEATRCQAFVEATLKEIEEQKPAVVLISHSVDQYVNLSEFSVRDPEGTLHTSKADKIAAWRIAQEHTMDRVRAAGARIVMSQPVPRFGDWEVYTCVPLLEIFMPGRCVASHSTASLKKHREQVRAFIESMSQPGISTVDYFDVLCPETTCTTRRNDHWLWADGQHVTKRGALLAAPFMKDALAKALG